MPDLDRLPMLSLPEEDMLHGFVSELRSEHGMTGVTKHLVTLWVDNRMPYSGWDRKGRVRDCLWLMIRSRQEIGV